MPHAKRSKQPLTSQAIERADGAGAGIPTGVRHEHVERLAYDLWQSRGGPTGSPDEDWYRAEELLRAEASSPHGQVKQDEHE
jgi:hypothetical protein